MSNEGKIDVPASTGMHWTENEPVRLPASRAGRVYMAGPMTGISELNFPAFNQEAERLRAEGLQVLNPADHGIVDGADWADYLRHDIAGLASCERIHLLRGWTKSKGACLEMTIAKALGMTVTYQVDAEMERSNAPAVQVYQLAKLGGPTETAWIDVTQEVYEDAGFFKNDFKRRILYATPATAPAVPQGRTELEIVEQTEELAAYLMHWRFGQEPESPSVKFRNTENVKAQNCWAAACCIQEMITATDVENAVAEVDDGQAWKETAKVLPQLHRAAAKAQQIQPVLTVEKEPGYWSGGHFYEGTKSWINPTKVWALPIGTKLYADSNHTPPVPCSGETYGG